MDKQVPLLTVGRIEQLGSHTVTFPAQTAPPELEVRSTYEPNTHEVVPKGLREAVEKVIADLKQRHDDIDDMGYIDCGRMARSLQRALNGEKS